MATSHIVACHIIWLLSSFHQIYNLIFEKLSISRLPIKGCKKINRRFCIHAARIIPPLTCTYSVKQPHKICISAQHQYLYYNSPFRMSVCRRSQTAGRNSFARSSREMSLTDRILPRYILSRVRVSVRPSNFLYAKNKCGLGIFTWPMRL